MNVKTKKGLAILLVVAMLFSIIPVGAAWAESEDTAVTGTEQAADSTIDLSTLTETYVISDSGEYTFTGTGSYGIKVESGNPTIILNNASITLTEGDYDTPVNGIHIASTSGTTTIQVLGESSITAKAGAGIFVAEGGTVKITGSSCEDILTVKGDDGGCGIGGYCNNQGDVGEYFNCGNITIDNLTVYAYGTISDTTDSAPAIGSVGAATCGTITINNAVVYAYSEETIYLGVPAIGNVYDWIGNVSNIPTVVIDNSSAHAYRGNTYSDYIGWTGDVNESATGSINCGEGGSVKNSTIYCYTGPDATTADKTVKYGALGGLLNDDGTCQGDHTGDTQTCKGYKCDNCANWYGEVDKDNHADEDKDHACDYGCSEVIGICEDTDKDHDCDYGCDKTYDTHADTDKNHKCDYGCAVAIGTCEDKDLDHDCDYGCNKVYGEHVDANTDHACDYGCTVVIGTHADSGKDHVCDYGCSVAIGTCEDKDKDHGCDYGCDKVYGTHEDTDKDHICDYGCSEAIGTCEDSDKDHDCDYGCKKYYGEHKDTNTDHVCDYGCSVTIGTHEDTDKDHTCDYGCSEAIGTCEDANKDHTCDYGCGKAYGTCEDKDLDHDCDYGCDKVYGTHEDTNKDHKCEYCDNTVSDCTDSNNDYKCDTCGKDLPRPSTPSYDYNYDYSYDYDSTDATVSTTDDAVTVTADSITTSTLNDAKDAVAEDDSATIIGGKDSAVEVTAKENGSTVSSFSEPVMISVPVSTSALKDVDNINNLTLALVETDANGDTTLTYIGGNYDTKTGTFSAYAAKPGNYVLVEKSDIIKIELTIGNQVAKVNGTPVVKDTHSRIIDSRTVVPVRFVAEQLGAKVDWNADTRTVTLTVDGTVITLPVDSIIPGYGTSAVIHDGRTLVPIRYVAEALGAHVVWVEEVQQVVIVK